MSQPHQYSFSDALTASKLSGHSIKCSTNRDLARFRFKDGKLQALSAVRGLWTTLVNIPSEMFSDNDSRWELVEEREPEVLENVEVLGIDLTPNGNDGLYNLTIAAQVDKGILNPEYFTNRRCRITIEAIDEG